MFNIFNNYNKLRTDGYYLGNKNGYSEMANSHYNLFFTIVFNKNGLVGCIESENEPYEPSLEEFIEFQTYDEYNQLDNFSRFELTDGNLKMKLYQPDSPNDYENGNINPKHYREWKGKLIKNGLILSLYKSGFNYPLQDYSVECYFENLEFQFKQLITN